MKSLYLSGVVGYEITAENIRSQINEGSKEKLQVIVNSPGGFVIDAFEIYNIFSSYKGEVEFVINGMAASAMSYIIMSGNKISAFKNSIFMAHKAQAVAIGDSDEMKKQLEICSAMDNILAESYVKRMKKPKEEILSGMKNEIWHIGWEALTEAGIIDNVIDSLDEIEMPDEEIKKDMSMIEEEFAKCGEPEKKKKAELQILSCINRMSRDVDRAYANKVKVAALLPQESKPVEIPVEDIIKTEEKMNLQDFLKANPEAEAEYKSDLLSAEAKGKAEAVALDRTRIVNILELAGAKLSEPAIKALGDGMDDKEYAVEELKRQKDIRAKDDKNIFASLAVAQTPGAQSPTDVPEEPNYDEIDKKIEASAQKHAKLGRII